MSRTSQREGAWCSELIVISGFYLGRGGGQSGEGVTGGRSVCSLTVLRVCVGAWTRISGQVKLMTGVNVGVST